MVCHNAVVILKLRALVAHMDSKDAAVDYIEVNACTPSVQAWDESLALWPGSWPWCQYVIG